jgi:hypothetical protein
MPMRTECKHYESRTYGSGDAVRKCNLDLAPEAPWRCPDNCPSYERRLADLAWVHGTAVAPRTPEEVPGLDDGSAAAVLDAAEEIVNSAGAGILADLERDGRRRWWKRRPKRKK